MKRILTLLLSFIMLWGTCAFAEEPDANRSYALSNIAIVINDQVIDLSNLLLELDVSADGSTGCVHLDADGETAAEVGVTKIDGKYVLHLAGANMGHTDFVLDPVVYMESVLRGGIEGVISLLQTVDTYALAQKIVTFLDNPASIEEVQEEVIESPAENEQASAPSITLEGDLEGAIQACITGPEITSMGGEIYDALGNGHEFPDGEYTTTEVNIDTETLADMLDMIYLNGEPSGAGSALRESGAEFTLYLASYVGEPATMMESTINFSNADSNCDFHIETLTVPNAQGSNTDVLISLTDPSGEGQNVAVQFAVSEGAHEGALFDPASESLEDAIDISNVEDEAAQAQISEAFNLLLGDVMIPIVGPLMETMLSSIEFTGASEDVPGA